MLKELQGNGILIHHWDTDGICSARLLLDYLEDKKVINKTPILGNYYLTKKELDAYKKFDFIIIADMSLPKQDILTLAENRKIIIFDHHLGEEIKEVFHYNPIIKGKNPMYYPSASWIINTYIGNKPNLFAFLGVTGDHEKKILKNVIFNKLLQDFCQEKKIEFKDLLAIVQLLDSNYKAGDKKEVENAPHYLLSHEDYRVILDNKKWQKNLVNLNLEIKKQLQYPPQKIESFLIKNMHTSYNIISAITRQIAWENEKTTMVINTGFSKNFDQVYIRSKKNLEPLITLGKKLGYKCGGKKEVFGAIVPKNQTQKLKGEIFAFFKIKQKSIEEW